MSDHLLGFLTLIWIASSLTGALIYAAFLGYERADGTFEGAITILFWPLVLGAAVAVLICIAPFRIAMKLGAGVRAIREREQNQSDGDL